MTKTLGTYIVRGKQKYQIAKTEAINIDNGSGTTADYLMAYFPDDVILVDAQVVYTEATDTTGAAAANVAVGVSAGGATIVTATALEAAKAIGGTTSLALNINTVPAGSTIFVRHVGIASTEVGAYFVQLRYFYK
jgi:hypothetical protein